MYLDEHFIQQTSYKLLYYDIWCTVYKRYDI